MGFTALHVAVANEADGLVSHLINKNADCNLQNNDKNTAFHLAVIMNRPSDVTVPLQKNTNKKLRNALGDTVVHSAVVANNKAAVNMLMVSKPAHVPSGGGGGDCKKFEEKPGVKAGKVVNGMGFSPAHIAAAIGSAQMLKLLQDMGSTKNQN